MASQFDHGSEPAADRWMPGVEPRLDDGSESSVSAEASALARLSVIIPALNSSETLPRCIAAGLRSSCGRLGEIIVVDGGSTDATVDIAHGLGARVVSVPGGRGAALAHGANVSTGTWLLFLHADTQLSSGWARAIEAFIDEPGNATRAAYFRFALDDASPMARGLERRVALRCQILALPFGDQGLLISRRFYNALGGFRPYPLMEDVDIIRRIGRHRLIALDTMAVTSAARWQREGWYRRSARNLACLTLYYVGVSPHAIARMYARPRRKVRSARATVTGTQASG